MIQIQSIEIEEFRGIKKLKLRLGRKNFGICGPNGTGKSGIVDAIEFGLTGDITRLGGSGTAEISVKAHAPHVDARKTPEKSVVKIDAYLPGLNKAASIERRVKTPMSPTVTPNDPKVCGLIEQLATHPEFALSRREIVKYILTPAGQRSKDVQALLRLDQIEKTRLSLQKISNDTKKESSAAEAEDARAKDDLRRHLGVQALSKTEVLAAVNERRNSLQLAPITDLSSNVSLKEGVAPGTAPSQPKVRVVKATALGDITSLDTYLAAAAAEPLAKARSDALDALTKLQTNPDALQSFRRQVLVQQGLELLEADACPLCDTAWDMAELQEHLQKKLAKASEAAAMLEQLKELLNPISANLEDIVHEVSKVNTICDALDPKVNAQELTAFSARCKSNRLIIDKVCSDPSLIGEATKLLASNDLTPTAGALAVVATAEKQVEALPDPSKEEAARDFLSVAQERYDRCRATQKEKDASAARAALSLKVLDTYNATSNAVLEGIYDAVEKDFTDYYRFINRDDEGTFEGNLTPTPAKLALDVDFYGRGKFPPGAYHSEGHQDGMGLCLYLALMKHTLGDNFTFAVLDDVLMSVDAGHRREVCSLLKTKFPKTQFLLTTHDPVWLQFMRTEGLIQRSINFAGWNVDTGPQVWNDGDVWQQISDKLAKNDVAGAAATLRRYLEYVATILADNLRAPVEYHGNGHYDLGDLMPPVLRTWKEMLNCAREAAVSWKQDTTAIEALIVDAKTKIAKKSAEQWMINKSIHYNEWATLQKDEFASVAKAFEELLKSMQCSIAECGEFLRVTPIKGEREALRCGCGRNNYNLKAK